MFRKIKFPHIKVEPEIAQRLDDVLAEYHELALSDPTILRLLIPSDEIWRLFVDGVRQEHNDTWVGFESREQGYIKALYTAFQQLFDPAVELNLDLIWRLHQLATRNVRGTNYTHDEGSIIGQFRHNDMKVGGYYVGYFNHYLRNATVEGLFEFLQQSDPQQAISLQFFHLTGISTTFKDFVLSKECIRAIREYVTEQTSLGQRDINADDAIDHLRKYFHPAIVKYASSRSSNLQKKQFGQIIKAIGLTHSNQQLAECLIQVMQDQQHYRNFVFLIISKQSEPVHDMLVLEVAARIKRFKQTIKSASSPIEKLSAIVSFIQSCERLHAFHDANCRTFCMLIHTYLLMRYGFPLSIMNDPNRFDAFSHRELLLEEISGMENTFRLINQGQLFGVKTNKILRNASPKLAAYFNDCVRIEDEGRVRPAKRQRCS